MALTSRDEPKTAEYAGGELLSDLRLRRHNDSLASAEG